MAIQTVPYSNSGFLPFGDAPIPAGFAGPKPGEQISATDSRWVVGAGQQAMQTYNSPAYISQPIMYFNKGNGPGTRSIEIFLGGSGLELYIGDTGDIALDYTLTNAAGAVAASFQVRVVNNAQGGVNQLNYKLPAGTVPAGVYTLQATLTDAMSSNNYGVFDTIKLL